MTIHLISGVAGQDGVLLARLLVAEGGRVMGTVQPGSGSYAQMSPYLNGVEVVEQDIRDTQGFRDLLVRSKADEVYNLASISSVRASWERPAEAEETNGTAVARLLDATADVPPFRFLQAASAEEDGSASESPYARGKAMARRATFEAREHDARFACSAVLYNHESPLRGQAFVTRKITRSAAEIRCGVRERLILGNLSVRRDWGSATDYVRAMRLMLAADTPRDFVVATGISHSLSEFLMLAFEVAGLGDPWPYVDQDARLTRPADAAELVGDARALRAALGWHPQKSFEEIVADMVAVDLRRVRSGIEENESYLI